MAALSSRFLIQTTLFLMLSPAASADTVNRVAEEAAQEKTSIRKERNARLLIIQSWHATRNGDFNLAIKLARQAVQIDKDDIDAHLVLAQSLQGAYENQVEKDPYLLNQCIKEWLVVYRGQAGDEKGLTFRGVGGLTDFYADEERGVDAKKQLNKITGLTPRPWETDSVFLKRFSKRTERNVSGKVVQRPNSSTDQSSNEP